ncbi:MAG: hypothetical protein M1820_002955 [Bogoriella megaspora]|nr:MAG: hypothetical protein M1820_002955 [Bogoriella megaspora]
MISFLALSSLFLFASSSPAPRQQVVQTFSNTIDCADAYEDCGKYASSLYEKAACKVVLGQCFRDNDKKRAQMGATGGEEPQIYCQSHCYEDFRECKEANEDNWFDVAVCYATNVGCLNECDEPIR